MYLILIGIFAIILGLLIYIAGCRESLAKDKNENFPYQILLFLEGIFSKRHMKDESSNPIYLGVGMLLIVIGLLSLGNYFIF